MMTLIPQRRLNEFPQGDEEPTSIFFKKWVSSVSEVRDFESNQA